MYSGRWLILEAMGGTWLEQGVVKGGTDLTCSRLTGIAVSRDEVQGGPGRENSWGMASSLGREAQFSEE
jgi:hypothetical protein